MNIVVCKILAVVNADGNVDMKNKEYNERNIKDEEKTGFQGIIHFIGNSFI